MFDWIMKKVLGTKNDREIKKIRPIVDVVAGFEPALQRLSNEELRGQTAKFKEQLDQGATLDDIVPEAFASVREAAKRALGQRHYDVQIIGGYALHKGMVAEMRTGEGKTLVSTLPAYLNALAGKGVHVVTVNDYLARRDAEWMGRVHKMLGLRVGCVTNDLDDRERQDAYGCDITYGQNNELGFDYLRDNMKFRLENYVHRYLPEALDPSADKLLNYAIVDEVDSILIDEARTPLIISGRGGEATDRYYRANAIIPFMKRDLDYIADEKAHTVALTESGVDKVEGRLKLSNLYDPENIAWVHHIQAALKAHTLFRKDVNYLIEDGKVLIIDEHTGRKMPGRRWSDGIHQAVEAKEGLEVEEENQTLATITFQNYFRMYKKLAGMTGTAETEAEELAKIYNLDVLVIPTNKAMVRADHDDVIYKTERAKFKAVIDEIKDCHERGQPVLVGTISVEKSEFLSHLLNRDGVPHNVLNAKQHAREAEIVAQAGRLGAVTISTNMAGRGTDILLGGNAEMLARVAVYGHDATVADVEPDGEAYPRYLEQLERYQKECSEEHSRVVAAGGLHILGTERHESRRIDNQLRGRAGRQGDPGSSRFFLSLDDELMRVFGGDRVKKIMEWLKVPEDEPIIAGTVTKAIADAQRRVEGHNFDARKNILEYDDVMNQQRKTIYALRRQVLSGARTHEMVLEAVGEVAYYLCCEYCPEDERPDEWDIEALEDAAEQIFGIGLDLSDVHRDFDALEDAITTAMQAEYEAREQRILDGIYHSRLEHVGGAPPEELDRIKEESRTRALEQWRYFERESYLRTIDVNWKEHLQVMEGLKEGIYLEAYAQKDPKLIYKKQGYAIFGEMVTRVRIATAQTLFRVEVKDEREIERMKAEAQRREAAAQKAMQLGRGAEIHGPEGQDTAMRQAAIAARSGGGGAPRQAGHSGEQAPPRKVETFRREQPKVGRNDPCPCGSGKKYKKCHGAAEPAGDSV